MASMKLCKPSYGHGYGYGSTQNFSEYKRHDYEMKQSSHVADHEWAAKPTQYSAYYNQAQNGEMDLSLHSFDDEGLGHHWASNSTHCHAQAQSVLPSPPVHALQENHVEKVKRQESHKSQEWANNTGFGSYSAPTGYSDGVAMHNKAHMAGKIEHDWAADRPIQCSSPIGKNQYRQSMFKEQGANTYYDGETAVEGGWARKPTNHYGSNHSSYSAQHMHHNQQQQHGWVDKPTKCSSPSKMHHSSLAMGVGKEEHMMGKVDHDWVSSPTRANHSSIAMHKDERMMGKMDHGWASSPTRASQSSHVMQKNEHMTAKMDSGWASSPTRAKHSSMAMHNDEHMMGKMDHSFAIKPTQLSSPVQANQYGQSTYKGHEEKAYKYNDHNIENGWANKSIPNQFNYSYQNQISHSSQGHAKYEHHDYENENLDDIMDEILTKYPAHNVNGNGYGNCDTKSGSYVSATHNHAKQQEWNESGHHGSAQSMGWNERKEEYSSASRAKRFEMNSLTNQGEIYSNGMASYGRFDY